MATIEVNHTNFTQDVLSADGPVLVDFWADWCAPCKIIAPALEEIAEELSGRVTIAKLDIVENAEIANQFGVRSVPLLILFKDGKPAAEWLGGAPKRQLKEWIESGL